MSQRPNLLHGVRMPERRLRRRRFETLRLELFGDRVSSASSTRFTIPVHNARIARRETRGLHAKLAGEGADIYVVEKASHSKGTLVLT